MKRKLLMVVLAFAFVLSIGLMVACADKGDDPVTGGDITLTVENVPKTGMVGREVKLPAASASDSKEGDLTDRVKLNVDLLKADGTTSKQVLFRVAANKEQKFTPSGNELLDYKITYFVSNDAGDTKEVKFDFKAAADTEAPVLSLDKSGDFANFDPATGAPRRISVFPGRSARRPRTITTCPRASKRAYILRATQSMPRPF